VKGNDGIALDMAQKICHKRYVTSSIYGPYMVHVANTKKPCPARGMVVLKRAMDEAATVAY